jgi:hypothetical protein
MDCLQPCVDFSYFPVVAVSDFLSDCSFVDPFDEQMCFGVDFAYVEYVLDAERPTAPMRHPGFLPTYLHVDSQRHCVDDCFGECFSYNVPVDMDFEWDTVEARYGVDYYLGLPMFPYDYVENIFPVFQKLDSFPRMRCQEFR